MSGKPILTEHKTTILKKAHKIADRTFVIIDDSLVTLFSIDSENTWFLQEAKDDGILLRIQKSKL
jgi:hypothetical protein